MALNKIKDKISREEPLRLVTEFDISLASKEGLDRLDYTLYATKQARKEAEKQGIELRQKAI